MYKHAWVLAICFRVNNTNICSERCDHLPEAPVTDNGPRTWVLIERKMCMFWVFALMENSCVWYPPWHHTPLISPYDFCLRILEKLPSDRDDKKGIRLLPFDALRWVDCLLQLLSNQGVERSTISSPKALDVFFLWWPTSYGALLALAAACIAASLTACVE